MKTADALSSFVAGLPEAWTREALVQDFARATRNLALSGDEPAEFSLGHQHDRGRPYYVVKAVVDTRDGPLTVILPTLCEVPPKIGALS